MSQEQNTDLTAWWNEQSFAGKELYRLDDDGSLVLSENNNIREHAVATLTAETAETVIKNLQEQFGAAAAKIKELELEWLNTEDKLKLADKVTAMREHLQHANAVGDMLQLSALVRDWEHTLYRISEDNYAEKLKLSEMAESLANSEEWKETAQAFKDLADKWKLTGHTDKKRSDNLWGRIEAARKTFNDRRKQHAEEDEKDQLHNLDLKIDLVEQAESIAASEDWKKTTDTFLRLTEEWKTIGRTPTKKNEELWQRFIAAKSVFFDKKRANFKKIKKEQEHNYEVKAAILEKAEALKESTDWGTTAQAFAKLMEEWKKTGRIPQDKGDELWKRFTAAQDQFFEAKHKQAAETKAGLDANYEIKKGLLERAEKLSNSNNWGEATAELTELLDEWKKTGPAPRAHSQRIWEEFIAARKHFFVRKDANRDQRKQYANEQKTARLEHARSMTGKMRTDLQEEELKITDFRAGLENITPGKKAQELRAHLENLISESEHKIKRLKEKLASVARNEDIPAEADNTGPVEEQ